MPASRNLIPEPSSRTLRIYTFDPSVKAQFDTAAIGEITIQVPWERGLQPGPAGEYVEVVDVDPASGVFYGPVDLNDRWLLAQDGLAPSESNPQFHQQMTYAVAMATIGHFERALGRVALWSSHREEGKPEQFVRRLRIYPHALRERNAFYSPRKKALLFGYFPLGTRDAGDVPETLVFTCLSHDIIAHETTHALLEGVHPRFSEPMNPDVLAFHEAFADIVALFQHFSYPGVLGSQIGRTRGNLADENLLGQLAQQFGKSTGRGGALRDALGAVNKATGKWEPFQPDVRALSRAQDPHSRGAILVAAVFRAFLTVYRARTADLYRIATNGTGVMGPGDIHPDLAARLAAEASQAASSVLQMCIRALDYCPPVNITFGDYLRAIVTADHDLNPEDPHGYRLAFLESFRDWGIRAGSVRSVSVEGLLWPTGAEAAEAAGISVNRLWLKSLFEDEQSGDEHLAQEKRRMMLDWDLESDRFRTWSSADHNRGVFWGWLVKNAKGRALTPALGILVDDAGCPGTVFRSERTGTVAVEVHSLRRAVRRSPRGAPVSDIVVEITQRRRGYFDEAKQRQMDKRRNIPNSDRGDFIYRAGCTLLIDPMNLEIRRVIRTPGTIADDGELNRQRRFLTGDGFEPTNAFDNAGRTLGASLRNPFALLHQESEGR